MSLSEEISVTPHGAAFELEASTTDFDIIGGQQASFVMTLTASLQYSLFIGNGGQTDPVLANNSESLQTTVIRESNLRVNQMVDMATAGQLLTYKVGVTNDGPSQALAVILTNTLPTDAAFIFVSPASMCTYSLAQHTVICDLGDVANGETVTVTLTVDVDSGATSALTNVVDVSSSANDPDMGNNNSAINTAVALQADLSLIGVAAPNPVTAGGYLTYTLIAVNNGSSDARNVETGRRGLAMCPNQMRIIISAAR